MKRLLFIFVILVSMTASAQLNHLIKPNEQSRTYSGYAMAESRLGLLSVDEVTIEYK